MYVLSPETIPDNYKPPVFTRVLDDLTIMEGTKAVLECKVEGHPTPQVEW